MKFTQTPCREFKVALWMFRWIHDSWLWIAARVRLSFPFLLFSLFFPRYRSKHLCLTLLRAKRMQLIVTATASFVHRFSLLIHDSCGEVQQSRIEYEIWTANFCFLLSAFGFPASLGPKSWLSAIVHRPTLQHPRFFRHTSSTEIGVLKLGCENDVFQLWVAARFRAIWAQLSRFVIRGSPSARATNLNINYRSVLTLHQCSGTSAIRPR